MDGELNQWASHLPALLACAAATDGPILEAGVGFNSTPMLHALCAPNERTLLSLDGNPEWLARFEHLRAPWHLVHHVADWSRPPLDAAALNGEPPFFTLAFVDHDKEPRGELLDILRPLAGIVVCHDSECHYAGYSEPLSHFDWHYTHTHSPAWTTVAGMGPRPDWLERALPPGTWDLPRPYRG